MNETNKNIIIKQSNTNKIHSQTKLAKEFPLSAKNIHSFILYYTILLHTGTFYLNLSHLAPNKAKGRE
jgi:hypothetical protein